MSPLSNDERRDTLDRLTEPEDIVALHISGAAPENVSVTSWHCDTNASKDDRDYRCPSCGTLLRASGVVITGSFFCCDHQVTAYTPAPPRHRR